MADAKTRQKADLKARDAELKATKAISVERSKLLKTLEKIKKLEAAGADMSSTRLKTEEKIKKVEEQRKKQWDKTATIQRTHNEDIKDLTKENNKLLQKSTDISNSLAKIGVKQLVTIEQIEEASTSVNNLAGTNLDHQTDISAILLAQIEDTNTLNANQAAIGTEAFQTIDYDSQAKDLAEERLKIVTGQYDLSQQEIDAALEVLDIAKKQLEVQKNISAVQEAEHEGQKSLMAGLDNMKSQAMALGGQLKAALANPALLLIAGLAAAGAQMHALFKGAQSLKTELGISDEAAVGLQLQISEVAMSMKMAGVESADVSDAAMGLMNNFGGVNEVNKDLLMNMAKMKADLGVSGTSAANLMVAMKATGAASKEAAFEMAKSVGSLAQAEGVAPGQVMQDIANNTEAFASFAKDGGMNVAKAAISAKKLGINFETSVKIADNLLDFESSIQSQMEAEILLGRQLNLDKARQLALAGDIDGLQKEVLKNIGSEAQFNAMNVLQRRALASSIGISVTELSKMVANQSNLNKQTKAQKESAAFMAHIMKAIRGLSEDLIKVWMVLKPIFMVALAPIGIAVFLLIKMVALIASGISAMNEFGNAGTIILGIVMAIMAATKLQALWTGIVTTAQWALNTAMAANPVGAIVMGVILLVALVVGLIKKFGLLKVVLGAIGIAMAIAFWPITLAIGAVWLLYKGFMWVADAVGGIGNLMMGIGAALLVAMGPVGWLIGAGIVIWKNFEKIWETIKGIGNAIVDFIMSPIRKLKAFFAGLLPGWALKLLGMGGGAAPEATESGLGMGGGTASEATESGSDTVAQDFISRPGSGMEKFDEGDTIVGVKDEASLGGGTSIDIVPITDGLSGVIDSINALEASNKALTNSLIGKVKTLSEQ